MCPKRFQSDAVDNALDARFRNQNTVWLNHRTTLNAIRQLATGSGPQHAFWQDFGGAMPPSLIGYPVYESSAMDATITSGSNDDVILLFDASQYVICDRVGMSVVFNPLVLGSNRRPSGEVGWFGFWRTGADITDPTNCRSAKLLRL